MDVDMDKSSSQEKAVRLHPLAIIGISDHHTRVSCGGSALPASSPVMGLLFGQNHQTPLLSTITIIDAEEVEASGTTLSESQLNHIKTKIELHQKVFPNHDVVGWYKVSEGEVTPNDLEIHHGWMKQFHKDPLFILMDTSEPDAKPHSTEQGVSGESAREKLDKEEELPLSVFESSGKAFIHLDFELESFGPERIAVEKVFNTRPTVVRSNESTGGDAKMTTEEDKKPAASEDVTTETEMHIKQLLTSVDAMNSRIAILLEYLRKCRDGEIPTDHVLLRQVKSLVKQLPLVIGRHPLYRQGTSDVGQELEKQYEDVLVLSFLATLSKTTLSLIHI